MSKAGIPIEVLERGLDNDAFYRLNFRLEYLFKAFQKRQEILRNGNLASWEPELQLLNQNFEDLTDVIRELIILMSITMNQKEQGVALPPNGEAAPSDAAQG